VKYLCRRIFIPKCILDNLTIGIIRSNDINFHEIMCSYVSKKVKNIKQPDYTSVSN
jgi:hypothetical protein